MNAASATSGSTTMRVIASVRVSLFISAASVALGAAPPADLLRRAAARETANEQERNQYTYRQSVTVEDFVGRYHEVRDVVFSASGTRSEEIVGKPANTLRRIVLTEEDARDIAEVQSLLITRDTAFLYESTMRDEETLDGVPCWTMDVRPRQILAGQRLFEGTLWIAQSDFAIVRMAGRAVPQIVTRKSENLFPRFVTTRVKIDNQFWFPVLTTGEDTLQFRTGPQRIRLTIRYTNYRRFSAESKVEYR